jgi:nitroreductase
MAQHTTMDSAAVERAIELATRAPSVHNTQPWQWRVGHTGIDLYADPAVSLPNADPDRRDLTLSCGVALHHLCAACAAAGWAAQVHRMPRVFEPNHLASIRLVARMPTDEDISTAAAITQRRTDRRPYSACPVPPQTVRSLIDGVSGHGVIARAVSAPATRAFVAAAQRAATRRHDSDPDYRIELATWSGGAHGSVDDGIAPQPFAIGKLAEGAASVGEGSTFIVIGTECDDIMARLRAGEAASELLLTATRLGLATCPITEPLEFPDIRSAIGRELLDGRYHGQLLIRIGLPAEGAAALPPTPRRSAAAEKR